MTLHYESWRWYMRPYPHMPKRGILKIRVYR